MDLSHMEEREEKVTQYKLNEFLLLLLIGFNMMMENHFPFK